MKTVTMKIKGGRCVIQTTGFAGTACTDETKSLRDRIGKPDPKDFEYSDEYYQEAHATEFQSV